jgi:outer membrane protein assembly factor BamB
MKINPQMRGRVPDVGRPVAFTGRDGRIRGWRVTLPGGHPLATPAVAEGALFLGGGFGSYDFYAFSADTGTLRWHYQTEDDGPTAAVVEDGHVVFNTESCELEVLDLRGRRVWKKWLGDPLMSMPALAGRRVYMAYPDSQGDRRHYLACFNVASGEQFWRTPITGEVITAPVLADGRVYFVTLDGTLHSLRQSDGGDAWSEPKKATSSPTFWNGQCYFSQRQEMHVSQAAGHGIQQGEHLAACGAFKEAVLRAYKGTARAADYLDLAKRLRGSPQFKASAMADAAVGFGAFKGDAKMHQAEGNLGRGHVHAVWAYQGSKPFIARDRMYSALGDTVVCADPRSDEVFWKKRLSDRKGDEELLDSVLTPPAVVNDKLFLGSITGEVYCLGAATGDLIWSTSVGEPIVFQPAVARGMAYVATGAGSLFGLETGDQADDGWHMWGGTAAHNGPPH